MQFSTIFLGLVAALTVSAASPFNDIKQGAAMSTVTDHTIVTVTATQTLTKYKPTKVTITETETVVQPTTTTISETLTKVSKVHVTLTETATKYRTKTHKFCPTSSAAPTQSVMPMMAKKARAFGDQPLYAKEFA